MPARAHSRPPRGSAMGTSTRSSPASLINRSAASSTLSRTADATTAAPRSTDTATRLPRTSCWPRPASQPSTRGQREGVVLVVAVADVEPAGGVAHRARQAPEDGGEGLDLGLRSLRDTPEGRLEAEQAGEAGRDPDGAAAVTARADREETAGDRCRGASGRAAGCPLEVVGVRRRTVQAGVGAVDATELRRGRLADQHGAGRPEPGGHGGVVVRDPVLEDERRLRLRPALDRVELLHADRAPRRRAG